MRIEYEGDSEGALDEVLRLTRENNRMLHAMRRGSLLSAIFKTVLWIAMILVPIWFYLTYIAPLMQSVTQTYQQIQGTSAEAQAQFGQFTQYMEQLKGLYGGGQQ